MKPPPHLRERILARISTTPSELRRDVLRRKVLMLSAAFLVLWRLAREHDSHGLTNRPCYFGAFVSLNLLLVVACYLLRRHVFPSPVPGSRPLTTVLAVCAVPSSFVSVAACALLFPETLVWPVLDAKAHLPCAVGGLVVGGLVALLTLFAFRRIDPEKPELTARAIGAAAGVMLIISLGAACPMSDPLHVLMTHAAPMVVLKSLSGCVGRRLVGIV